MNFFYEHSIMIGQPAELIRKRAKPLVLQGKEKGSLLAALLKKHRII
jgi:hypothetical protein